MILSSSPTISLLDYDMLKLVSIRSEKKRLFCRSHVEIIAADSCMISYLFISRNHALRCDMKIQSSIRQNFVPLCGQSKTILGPSVRIFGWPILITTLFNSAVRKIKHKSSKQHRRGLPLFLFFARFSKSKSLLSAQRTPLCKHVNIMNMADGFGWQPSSKTLRAEDSDSNGAIDSARQSPSFWDSVATTVKRTVSYANSEFERFFGSMGFRSPPNASNVQVMVASVCCGKRRLIYCIKV